VILNLLEAATGEPVREAVWSPLAPEKTGDDREEFEETANSSGD
jgi:hypothetical protein